MIELLLSTLDRLLALALPATFRLVLWSTTTGVVSMAVYRWCSPQRRLEAITQQIQSVQHELRHFQGEFCDAVPLLRRQTAAAISRVGLTIGPSILGGLPVIAALLWMEPHFARRFPESGEAVSIAFQPPALPGEIRWNGPDKVGDLTGTTPGMQPWPGRDNRLVASTENGHLLVSLPTAVPVARVGKRVWWWHSVIASPVGYLPADTRFKRVTLDLPSREYLWFGPYWARTWLFASMLFITLGAAITKLVFKVK